MALGKISGHMLSSNLIRNNVDLSFETNLLYFSVSDANPTNYKIGINTDSPAYLLDVSGTTRTTNFKSTNVDIGNLNVTNNTLTSIGDLTISAVSNNIILSSNLVSNNKVLIGSSATTTRFPNAKVAISETAAGIQQNENGNIGIVAEAVGAGATRNAGVYGVGYTAGSFTGQGVVGESHVSATGDTAPAVGVRGYANDTHAGGINVGLYGDATNGNANYSLYLNSGDIYSAGAKTWYLNGNLTFNGAYSITIPTLALTNALPVTSGGTGVTTSTGTGNVVLSNNPTLVTPTLGNATATTINKVTITAPANSATLTLIDGKTLTVNNTLSFTGTDASSVSFGTGGTVVYAAAGLSQFTASSTLSSALAAIMSDETGTGLLVFNNAPTFIAPVLGAASATSLTLSNPLPVTSGGTGVTTKTGTGNVVLSSSPSLTTAITTTSTSFDLLDTTATTINFGRAATTITMGSNTSTIHMQHDLQVDGDIYFNGTANQLSATNLSVNDSLIYLAVNNVADILDIGWVGAYNPAGTHLHTGLVRDATDGVWKLYSNIIPEPDTTVDFTSATYDSLQIGKLIGTSALIGSAATSARFPNAKVAISDTAAGLQQSETHNIGLIAEATAHPTNTGIYGIGVYGVGYTNAATRSGGVVGEGHVSATGDTGSAIGVRGYANDTHAGGMNIGLYADASNSSINNYALYMNSGNITNVAAQTWTLGGNLSFSGAYTVSVPSLTATGVITANTTTNNQTYTTTSTGTITISSGSTGNIDNMNIGNTTAAIGKFTTLSASGTVSGTGFSTYLSSPPAIGNTTANTGAFTTLTTTSTATIGSDLTVTGNLTVNGTTTTVNSTTVTVDDKNIELGSVATPTNTTADGGGITLRGATDKTITWDSTNTNWTSSENWNIATGKTYKINNVNVLTSSAVLNDSTQTTVSVGSYATTLNLGASNSGNAFINNNVLYVGGATALSTATAGIEVGGGRTGSGISYIDLTSDTTYADYSARFLRNAGANSNTILSHRGTGNLIIGAVEAGVIEFDTSNTERMRIDSVGNVGIGTTTPNTGFGLSLQVYNNQNTGTVASNSYINVQSVNRNAVVELCSSSTGISALNFSSTVGTTLAGIAGDIANQTLIFRTGGAIERMRIDSVGNVGIGTTTPVSKLHVLATGASNGTINSRTALHIQNNNVTTGNGNARIQFSFDPATPKAWIEAGVYGTDYLAFGSSAGATESMRIDSSGRVLIGNSTAAGVAGLQLWGIDAAAQQHIRRYSNDAAGASINLFKGRGDATTSAIVQNGDSLGYIGFSGHDGSSTLPTATIITARIEAVVDGVPGTNDMPSRLVFSTTSDGSATITERMRINSSGNVLIGTTTDDTTSKLQVNGTVKATAFIGDATGLTYTGASIRPSLLLDFANSKFLDQGITFTRATTATYYGYDGLLRIAASSEARFDHDPVTEESLGLLIEEQRTNLLTYSENFDNAAWAKTAATVTSNAITAPDGTLTADKLVEDTANTEHYADFNNISMTSGQPYTISVYAKAGDTANRQLSIRLGLSNQCSVHFNLTTGIGAIFSTLALTPVVNPSLSLGDGWFRLSITLTAVTTAAVLLRYGIINNTTSYTGDGTSGIYIWGAQLEAGAFPTSYIPSNNTFTSRASTGTYIGSNGLIQSAATNVARYSYNPSNLGIAGKLLLEPAATNLLTYSEQFNMWSEWQLNTTTANATTAPDGNATADKIIENSTTNVHNIAQPVNVTSGTTYTMSCYIKAAERFKANLVFWTNNSAFPLTGLTIDLISGAFSVSGNQIAYSVIPHSSGWYRCSITQTASATATGTLYIGILNDSGDELYTGNGTSGIYIWGAQLETGTTATSYIPTTSAQTTRAADVSSSAQTTRAADNAVMTGTNFSSWYRQDEGSIFVKSDTVYATPTSPKQTVMFANSIDYSKIVIKNCRPSSLTGYTIWNNSDVVQSELSSATTVAANTMHLIAASYKTNDCAMSTNGATVATNTTAVIPTDVVKLYIGGFTAVEQNGHISKLAYYPKRLSNAELQSITTG